MKKKLDILKWLLPLVVLLATACGHDDLVLPDEYQEESPTPYVEIRIAVPLANPYGTRANPMGGEEGNGREPGILHEDDIHDINVIFFKSVDGLNCSDDTEIIEHIYYNLDNLDDGNNTPPMEGTEMIEGKVLPNSTNTYYGIGYVSLKFKCTEEMLNQAKDLNFAAFANAGPIDPLKDKTMKEVREQILSYREDKSWNTTADAFSKNAKDMNYFLMSTAYTNEYYYGGQSTGTNKFEVSSDGKECKGITTMQRLYARLDLLYNRNQFKTIDGSQELDYQIKDKNEATLNHHVFITNVLPVNVMQTPSYLFKKVTNTPDDEWLTNKAFWNKTSLKDVKSFTWGGRENPDATITAVDNSNDRPKNYVMERHTLDKITVTEISKMTKADSTAYADGTLRDWYGNTRASKIKSKAAADQGYSIYNEANGKLTGYYHGKPASSNTSDYDSEQIAIISYANENTHPTDCFHSNYLTGMAFRAVYVPEKIYKEFSENTTKDENDKVTYELVPVADNESIGDSIYRYSPTAAALEEAKSRYFTTRSIAEDYAKKNPGDIAVITSYKTEKHDGKWGFVCYYNLWLRHYNDVNDTNKSDPHEHLPMEYATVRNNIYRVSVDFSGPGDPEPTMREPDTMKARIYVRKWNYREEDEIIF
ncbi:MAG: fimbria major subunit [Muribaculaceae bacterium]|nr:fimbria major subunit [Muribaculaceae bacterium]